MLAVPHATERREGAFGRRNFALARVALRRQMAKCRGDNTGHYQSEGHEDLVDSFLTDDGPADRKQISARLAELSIDELRELAAVANRKAFLFRSGRPRQIKSDPWLMDEVAEIKSRMPNLSDRSVCEHLSKKHKHHRGQASGALRQRYLKAKSQRP